MKTTPLSSGSSICTFGFQTENLISLAPSVSLSGETQFKQKYTQVALVVKNPPANAGHVRNSGSIPESGRSPGRGHGKPLQYSCLENPMDRGAWLALRPKGHKELNTMEVICELSH